MLRNPATLVSYILYILYILSMSFPYLVWNQPCLAFHSRTACSRASPGIGRPMK
jgi:hypothetical protein